MAAAVIDREHLVGNRLQQGRVVAGGAAQRGFALPGPLRVPFADRLFFIQRRCGHEGSPVSVSPPILGYASGREVTRFRGKLHGAVDYRAAQDGFLAWDSRARSWRSSPFCFSEGGKLLKLSVNSSSAFFGSLSGSLIFRTR